MKKKYIMAAVVSLFLSGVLNAQTNTYNIPEQLSELIKKAFDNYPKLKAGDAYIKMDQTQCDLAKAGYMPTIDGEANYRYGKPTPSITFPGFGSFAFFPANNYDLHVGAALPIWDFGRTAANVKKTLAEIQTSKDNLESAKQDLAYQIAELYCAIIFYNKSVEVENEQIKVLQDNVDIIAKRVQDGDALKFDLLSTQVKLNNSQNQLIDLQNNLEKDYEFLDMLTAQQGDGYITREDIGFNTSGHEDVSSDKNYDLIIMNDQMNSSQVDIKSARNNW